MSKKEMIETQGRRGGGGSGRFPNGKRKKKLDGFERWSGCQMALSIPRERLDFASTCEKCDESAKYLGIEIEEC